jgi:hypothetical protein
MWLPHSLYVTARAQQQTQPLQHMQPFHSHVPHTASAHRGGPSRLPRDVHGATESRPNCDRSHAHSCTHIPRGQPRTSVFAAGEHSPGHDGWLPHPRAPCRRFEAWQFSHTSTDARTRVACASNRKWADACQAVEYLLQLKQAWHALEASRDVEPCAGRVRNVKIHNGREGTLQRLRHQHGALRIAGPH